MRRGRLTATVLAFLLLLPGPGRAKPPLAPDAEWLRLEAQGATLQRSGSQDGPWPGIAYRGWTQANLLLRAEAFTPGPGLGFGAFLQGGFEGFRLDDAAQRLTSGSLLRASVGPAVRFAIPAFELQAGVGYGLAQLPELGPSAAPNFNALNRHALIARLGLRVPLFSVLTLEANGQAVVLGGGAGLLAGGHGYTVGAALGVPVAQLTPSMSLRARVGYEAILDGWRRTATEGAEQTLHRVGLGFELAFARPAPATEAVVPVADAQTAEAEQAPQTTGLLLRVAGREGVAVEGAWARLGEQEVKATDASAPLLLKDLPAGTHSFSVGAPGHVEITDVVQLVEGTTLELDVELTPQTALSPAAVVGQVRSARTGRPLKAVLTIENRAKPVRTDAQGRFTLELPDGTWTIRISAQGHLSQSKQLALREGDRAILNVDLHPERR